MKERVVNERRKDYDRKRRDWEEMRKRKEGEKYVRTQDQRNGPTSPGALRAAPNSVPVNTDPSSSTRRAVIPLLTWGECVEMSYREIYTRRLQ